MSYLNRLESDEMSLLMDHPDGMKCWQTDYKILREYREELALAYFNEDIALRESLNTKISDKPKEQELLFPIKEE